MLAIVLVVGMTIFAMGLGYLVVSNSPAAVGASVSSSRLFTSMNAKDRGTLSPERYRPFGIYFLRPSRRRGTVQSRYLSGANWP